ncbi:hypothetical protein LZF95_23785 [Algoriphagus sp. AGSA1]|uniref:hypothetical protein n=1 Tax=Algoriphagus sp. AGSA1 TaxID=2907213 RepID=UPI001F2C981C|nr:hypothetical protein [Algoriphagus sp. AGSA1]MCE7057725.1 hypothetical protein [Algoriphagus sp. AGSA1]
MFGDFYDERGKKLGADGNDDVRLYVDTNRQEAKSISATNKSGGTTQASSVFSAVELPSAKVRKEMGKAVTRSNQPSGDDTKGGFHEEGGIFGTGNKRSDQVIYAKPGGLAIPGVDEFASVDPFSGETSDNYLNEVDGTFHTHPSGRNSAGGFDQYPSDFISRTTGERMGDIPTAISQSNPNGVRYVKGNHYVLGTGNDRVTIYNGSNPRVATFPLRKFISIGIK